MKTLALSLIIAILLSSCTKEKVSPTSADEITTQLKKVIAENSITKIIAWDDRGGFPTNIPPTLGNFWVFSNGFITINGYGYDSKLTRNLLYLDSYDISKVLLADGSDPVALILHFRSNL